MAKRKEINGILCVLIKETPRNMMTGQPGKSFWYWAHKGNRISEIYERDPTLPQTREAGEEKAESSEADPTKEAAKAHSS